jgi:dipeptidyl aminopeptidase/acylaminoacyl peptidase
MRTRTWLFLLLPLLVPFPILAQQPKRTHDITVDDYFTLGNLFEVALSPDGKNVAYAEGRWQKSTDDRKADLWVTATQDGTPRQLTADRAGDRVIRWGADGKNIYFMGNRKHDGDKKPPYDGKPQVWQIPFEGGEPKAVTRLEEGVQAYDLAPDGRSLYYVVEVAAPIEEWKNLKEEFHGIEYGHGTGKVSQLWRLDLQTAQSEKVRDDKRVIRDLAVAPDGKRIAMITTPDVTVVSFEGQSRVDVVNPGSGKVDTLPDKLWRADAPSPYGWLENLAWAPDSRLLAFNVIFDGYPAEVILANEAGGTWSTSRLKRPAGVSIRGYGTPLAWAGDTLLFLGEARARVRPYGSKIIGSRQEDPARPWIDGDVVVEALSANARGEAAVIMNDTTHAPDVFFTNSAGYRRVTNLSPQVDTWRVPDISTVSWKGANGEIVEGVLELPADYRPGTRVPLVVEIHGGPTTASRLHFQFWIYGRVLLPAKGYAVFSPNYRGSVGYGDRFLTDLLGHENELDVEDILRGVDMLVERGIADPERLGVMGWSNGGYLTNCIITKTNRFKAASSGAGITDTVMEFGINDEPAYSISLKQGFPWNKPDIYRKTSPTYALDRVRTPTLIHVGAGDERCPPPQSKMLYRALKEYAKVPTELLVYPGEPHGLSKYSSRKAKMEWDLAWFERYILYRK